VVGLTRPRLVGQPALSVDANLAPLRFPCGARGFFCGRSLVQPTKSRTFDERACWSAFAELATNSVKALSGRLAYPPPLMPLLTQGVLRALFLRASVGGRRVTPLKEALTALADVLAKRPAQESYSTGFALDGWSANFCPDQAQASRGASRD
jgi:hypothetical protein